MEQLKALSRARQIVLGAAVLLLIATFLLPWQKVSSEDFGLPGGASQTWNAWEDGWGVIIGLLTIAIVLWIALRAFGVELPENIPDGVTTLGLGVAILAFTVLKVLVNDYRGWGAFVGIILAAAVAYGAWMNFKESGEELPGRKTTGAPGNAAVAAAPAAAPAAAAPATPPASDPPASAVPPPAAPQEPASPPPSAEPSANAEDESPPPSGATPA